METTTSAHETRITGGQRRANERETPALRPRRLAEFIGQGRTCAVLSVMIEAAAQRAKPIDHILFYGPPGLGKTSLAHIIAQESSANIRITSGPALKFAGELASILTRIEPGDVLFIDEVHRLNPKIEETLYPAMEDFALDLMLGKGATAREYRMSLPPFTIVGATTRLSLLSGPLRDRFGAHFRLDFYEVEELCRVVQRAATLQRFPLDESATRTLASRARGTPASLSVCCAVCMITQPPAPMAVSPTLSPKKHSPFCALMPLAWRSWTDASCGCSSRNLMAARSG